MRRTKSFGRASGISYLRSTEHTRETPETHFIRNATGRGSIKKPAPTKAFLLRMQVRPVYFIHSFIRRLNAAFSLVKSHESVEIK